jgi:hypothetical protein
MTLKQSVENPRSPLRAFFNERLPNTRSVHKEWKQLRGTGICIAPPVDTVVTAGGATRRYPFDEVGHAASLRLTLLFSSDVNEATRPPDRHPRTRRSWPAAKAFHAEFATALGLGSGFDPLPADQERRLIRLCYVAGLFDQYLRIGAFPGLPLLEVRPDATVDELLDLLVDEACVVDLLAIVTAARSGLAPLIFPATRVVVGPTFVGSADVGGADGDLLIGGTLLELKTRLKLELQQRHLHQLVAYALLDFDDLYGISDLAMFSARHASLICWPLDQVIEWLAGTPTDVAELRGDLRTHLRAGDPVSQLGPV